MVNRANAVIGNGNGAAGAITINEPGISASGVTFNAPGGGNYIIAATGANSLTLSGAAAISVPTGLSPTIGAPIAGTAGLALAGPGRSIWLATILSMETWLSTVER